MWRKRRDSWDNLILSAKGNLDSPTVTCSQNPRHEKATTVNEINWCIHDSFHLFASSSFFSTIFLFLHYTLHYIYCQPIFAYISQHVIILGYTWLYCFYYYFSIISQVYTSFVFEWIDGSRYDGLSDHPCVYSITSFSDGFASISNASSY